MKRIQDNCKLTPLVSIVLPTYNGSRYINEAIRSILAQTYKHWELVIVDDCSTDETFDICEQASKRDDRIKVVRNSINKKLPESLNVGFKLTKGKYLTWTSDDNIYYPMAIEEMVRYLESHKDVGMVFTRYDYLDEEGNITGKSAGRSIELLPWQNVVGACFLYVRSVYEKIGEYDTTLFTAEDWDYWLRIYSEYEIKPLDKVLYGYRLHAQSLTQSRAELCSETRWLVLEKNLAIVLKRRPHLLSYALLGLAEHEWQVRNYRSMKKLLLRALLNSPCAFLRHGKRMGISALLGKDLAERLGVVRQ